jgi:alkanesulfonate monooxygenase SsuD/methylene tetrahydromethanopterin reductase-like flavin-dependent oxidoreductase (luciferase family)
VKTPTFGLFDHIEGIPGDAPRKIFMDRLDFIRQAEDAGFASFHLAEHHGTDLSMAPNQDVFVAAASQITDSIRLGPMVKLLPMHHPTQVVEDLCVLDQLTNGRLDYGVGRGAVPVEHAWHGGDFRSARERFVDYLGIIADALRSGEVSSENSEYLDFPTMPLTTRPLQETIPFYYPGNPVTAGRYGMHLVMAGPVTQDVYDAYHEAWERHKGDRIRLDGPNSEPTITTTMLIAIDEDEGKAVEIAQRGMDGLQRRTFATHRFDQLIIGPEEQEAALAPLKHIQAGLQEAVKFGAGTPSQLADRMASMLEPGLIDRLVLMTPTGDITMAESRKTLELFATEVKPQLEMQPA